MRIDCCQVAKGMIGQSGRLLRDKMLQHFASVSQHAFSMMLDSQVEPLQNFLDIRYPKDSKIVLVRIGQKNELP